jgi:protoporphyrinogen oxidase
MTVYVLGGGPAGLAVAHGLIEETKTDVVVIERSATLGGLAQTVNWEGCGTHDLGPHKIFTLNAELMHRVEALLRVTDWLTREKRSVIFMSGHFLPYPPSPFSLVKVFGPFAFLGMTAGYLAARLKQLLPRVEPMTFEEDLRSRVGAGLYEVLFCPIAMKLWGDPARLDIKLSRGRVQIPNLAEMILRLMGFRKKSEFEALTFRYPRGGLQRLWDAIRKRCGDSGKFLLDHEVDVIDVVNRRVTAIRCHRGDGTSALLPIHPGDFVVSTLPIGLSAEIMQGVLSEETQRHCKEIISLNDLLLVFLHMDTPSLFDESWIFVPDPSIAFHRVSEQESFDPGMTPNGSIVCCEIMSNENRPMSAKSNEELVDLALQGLAAMGYADYRVLKTRVIRLPKSYPVFRPGFEPKLRRVLSEFDSVENFRTIGRQGAFNYIGTLDAMDIGYGFVDWYKDRAKRPWQTERERTDHYPVLD